MTMTYEQVQPDTRVVLTAHDLKATVLTKFWGKGQDNGTIVLDVDGYGWQMRTAEQLTQLDEPAPAPRLMSTASRKVKRFYVGGHEYHVYNSGFGARGCWQVWRHDKHNAAVNADCIVSRSDTRNSAFTEALRALDVPAAV